MDTPSKPAVLLGRSLVSSPHTRAVVIIGRGTFSSVLNFPPGVTKTAEEGMGGAVFRGVKELGWSNL